MVGTEDYISPEVLLEQEAGPAADLWSLGVILFMMLCGKSPFRGNYQYETLNNIKECKYSFPEKNHFLSLESVDLI